MVNAVNRITGKNYLVSFDNLVRNNMSSLSDLVTELFIARPRLNAHGQNGKGVSEFHTHMQVIEEFMREQQTYIDAGLDKSNLLQSLPKMLACFNRQ